MKVLVVAAHPDDELLGCGGTIAQLEEEDCIIEYQILGSGRGDELDNQFDKKSLLFWVKGIEAGIKAFRPDIIFTHYEHDLNIDHRMTYQAVITAARPMSDYFVKEIYSFEVLSSTEWVCSTSFSPDIYYPMTARELDQKWTTLVAKYSEELREWPHPRSYHGIFALAQYRGMQVGVEYAEAFKTVRVIR